MFHGREGVTIQTIQQLLPLRQAGQAGGGRHTHSYQGIHYREPGVARRKEKNLPLIIYQSRSFVKRQKM